MGYFGSLGCILMAVAVVERLKYSIMDCPLGQQKVAVVGRWPLVKVQLYKTAVLRRIAIP